MCQQNRFSDKSLRKYAKIYQFYQKKIFETDIYKSLTHSVMKEMKLIYFLFQIMNSECSEHRQSDMKVKSEREPETTLHKFV